MTKRIAQWPVFVALALVLFGYGWTWRSVGGRAFREPQGYYGLLTDALLNSKHLYLKIAPDPRLALLANPWASNQGVPRLHDATYFHGRYYLYFGITPVLTLLGPWYLLTETYLTEGAAIVIFGLVGFLAGLDLLRRLGSQLPVSLSPPWAAAGLLAWGLGSFAFVLMQDASFYQVPIMAAYACLMCALASTARAADAEQPRAAERWLAAASLAWGLAVGARPHYVFSLPLVLVPLVLLRVRKHGSYGLGWRIRLAMAAALPAAAIGCFLAWYNWARFGTAFEFGFHFQFTAGDQRFIKMWNPSLIGPNLRSYLFAPSLLSPYFPFFIPDAGKIGMVALAPLTVLALAFPFTLRGAGKNGRSAWLAAGTCACAAGSIHLLGLCVLPIGASRYLLDFVPAFTIGGLATAAYLLTSLRRGSWTYRAAAGAIGILGSITVAASTLLAVNGSGDPGARRTLAGVLDRPAAFVERLLGAEGGPLRLEMSLDRLGFGQPIPLVETGGGGDVLLVQRTDTRHVRFSFRHRGDPELSGPEISFVPDAVHEVVADLGSLYPPDEHPLLAQWSQPLRDALHRRVRVELDGRNALDGASAFYPSDPLHIDVREDGLERVSRANFPLPQTVERDGWSGPVRLHLRFPQFHYYLSEPLVSTGAKGAGDMVYVTYLGPGRVRFGLDSSAGGAIDTADVAVDPAIDHVLDVDLASLRSANGSMPEVRGAFHLRLDGRDLIYADRPMNPSRPFEVAFGFNSLGMGTARDSFSGTILRADPIAPLPPPASPSGGAGPLEIVVRFPPAVPGVHEPLVVTGREGAGDFVYVIYEAKDRIRLGVDHWSVGGVVSEPIAYDLSQSYTLTVSSAAMYPNIDDSAWGAIPPEERRRLLATTKVKLNGRPVLDVPLQAYPSDSDRIRVGRNWIGGSTCGTQFSGQILSARRLGVGISERKKVTP